MSAGEDPAALAARLTGVDAAGTRDLGSVTWVDLADGDAVVVKRDDPGAIDAEAAGLRWLGAAAGPGLGVPAVRGHEGRALVGGAVRGARPPTADDAHAFGRGLAALHAAGAPAFGTPPPGGPVDARIGLAPMRDVAGQEWPGWFAEHRVRPYLRTLRDRGDLDARAVADVEAVLGRLRDLAGPPEPPARLHGDLWSGNVLWAPVGGRPGAWVIDPAAHGGHRESDLAMLELFGLPRLEAVLAAYDEAAPLAPGRRERVAIHQLFPLLVHGVLFGGGFARRAHEQVAGL